MNELRECPFCETKDIKLFYWDNALVWKLECTVCHVTYTHTDKEKIIKFWNSRPKEDAAQEKIIMLREDVQIFKTSYTDMQNERDILQEQLNALKSDMETARNSFFDIQNKRDILQKELGEAIKTAKQEQDTLKTKLSDEQKAHEHYINTMQNRINNAEKLLANTISSYNAKLETIKLKEYETANTIMEKIRKG